MTSPLLSLRGITKRFVQRVDLAGRIANAFGAGVHVCLARYGFGYEQFETSRLTGVEALVDSPVEIPNAVRRLLNTTAPRP